MPSSEADPVAPVSYKSAHIRFSSLGEDEGSSEECCHLGSGHGLGGAVTQRLRRASDGDAGACESVDRFLMRVADSVPESCRSERGRGRRIALETMPSGLASPGREGRRAEAGPYTPRRPAIRRAARRRASTTRPCPRLRTSSCRPRVAPGRPLPARATPPWSIA